MATYLPSASGAASLKAASGQSRAGSGHIRVKVDQSYTSLTNTSVLTFTLQFYGEYSGAFTPYDGGVLSLDGTDESIDHYLRVQLSNDSTWRNMTRDSATKTWTRTVVHNSDGTRNVPVSFDFTLRYSVDETTYTQHYYGNYTLSLSNTPSYTLTFTAGANTTIRFVRDSSPSGQPTGQLGNGNKVFRGDVIHWEFTVSTGYEIDTHTIQHGSGSAVSRLSGYSLTVSGAVTAVTSAKVRHFSLTISPGTGTTLSVSRTASPLQHAPTGVLGNGDTIYYGDVLSATAQASSGYVLGSLTINGVSISPTSGSSVVWNDYTVTSATSVSAAATQAGVYIYTADGFASYQIRIYNGATWDVYIPYVYTGSGWEVY